MIEGRSGKILVMGSALALRKMKHTSIYGAARGASGSPRGRKGGR
jgi:short-subunit dehydrogenase